MELSNALRDVELALKGLRIKKTDLKREFESLGARVSEAQSQEVRLKSRLSELGSKEESLTLKKQKIKDRLEKLEQKISRYAQIEAEMEQAR